MVKVSKARVCPFSNGSCRECPIYRGRHSELCVAARYLGKTVKKSKLEYQCSKLEFPFPEDVECNDIRLKNIEDRVQEDVTKPKTAWK